MNPTKSISQTFTIAKDITVNRIGYGAMRLTGKPGNFGPYQDWEAGEKLLQRAVELGVNFIDTAEAYGPGHNEDIIASALYPYKSGVIIATKGGINKPAPDNIKADGSPEFLRRGVEGSLKRLKLEQIDLYQLHRPDSKVPFSESIGALAELKKEGKIRHIGISNVNLEQIKEATNVVEIASVQNRFSITNREKEDTLNYCSDNGIAFLPYGSLDAHPLKQGAPLANAEGIIADIALKHGVKPNQIALAWLLHRAANIILIPGTTTIAHVEENVKAGEIQLTEDEMTALNSM